LSAANRGAASGERRNAANFSASAAIPATHSVAAGDGVGSIELTDRGGYATDMRGSGFRPGSHQSEKEGGAGDIPAQSASPRRAFGDFPPEMRLY
jgi:hypothetical protein